MVSGVKGFGIIYEHTVFGLAHIHVFIKGFGNFHHRRGSAMILSKTVLSTVQQAFTLKITNKLIVNYTFYDLARGW